MSTDQTSATRRAYRTMFIPQDQYPSGSVTVNELDLMAAIKRLMGRVDYYLHCEIDEDYDHERPDTARSLLEAAIRQELQRASANGLMSSSMQAVRLSQ